jgi:hypothetical protein
MRGEPSVVTGCMAVEMHTGDPLFPGESDVDQLWLILKGMGSLTPGHTHLLSRNPYFTVRTAAWKKCSRGQFCLYAHSAPLAPVILH